MSCAGTQRGAQTAVLIDYEQSYGVDPVAFAAIQMPFISEDISGTRAQNQSEVINGRRDSARPFQGNKDVQGSITVPIDKRYFGYWLRGLLGAPTTTGAGPYNHEFKIDNINCLPSLVIEKQMLDIPRYFKYNGMKVSTMSISVGGDGELQATFGLIGQQVADSATSIDATPTTHTYEQFRQFDAVLNEAGVANGEFLEFSMDVDNNLDPDIFAIGDGGTRGALPEGKLTIEGTANTLFDNMALYDKAANATETSIEVVWTRDTESLSIDFNEVELALQDPKIEGPQGVVADFDYIAYFDDDAGDSSIVITIINDIASYV